MRGQSSTAYFVPNALYTSSGYGSPPRPGVVEVSRSVRLGSKYAVLLWPRVSQASYLYEHGWKIVKSYVDHGEEEGWIFALDERLLYPQPGSFGKQQQKESPDSISD